MANSAPRLIEKATAEYEEGKRKEAYPKLLMAASGRLFKLSSTPISFDEADIPNAKLIELLEAFEQVHDALFRAENVLLNRPVTYREKPEKKKKKKKKNKKRRQKRIGDTDEDKSDDNDDSRDDGSSPMKAADEAATIEMSDSSDSSDTGSHSEESDESSNEDDTRIVRPPRFERTQVVASIKYNGNDEDTLPQVPFSPLWRAYLVGARRLAKANRELKAAKSELRAGKGARKDPNRPTPSLAMIRQLDEDEQTQHENVKNVKAQIAQVQDKTLLQWDADQLARQWCTVNAGLFARVDIRRDLSATRVDSERVGQVFGEAAEACIDFEHYITHSVAHLLVIGAEEARPGEVITKIASAAHRSLHRYRDLNTFAGLMHALASTAVQRLDRAWHLVPKSVYQRLVKYSHALSSADLYRNYTTLLENTLADRRIDMGTTVGMALVPWMRPHCDMLQTWLATYTTPHEGQIMSDPGMKKLDSMHTLLKQCQHYTGGNAIMNGAPRSASPFIPAAETSAAAASRGTPKRRILTDLDGSRLPLPIIGDLTSLSDQDLGLQHWLVSRVYLTRRQLWAESLQIQSAAPGEYMPLREDYQLIGLDMDLDNKDAREHPVAGKKQEIVTEIESKETQPSTQGPTSSLQVLPTEANTAVEGSPITESTKVAPVEKTTEEEKPTINSATEIIDEAQQAAKVSEGAVQIDGKMMTAEEFVSLLDDTSSAIKPTIIRTADTPVSEVSSTPLEMSAPVASTPAFGKELLVDRLNNAITSPDPHEESQALNNEYDDNYATAVIRDELIIDLPPITPSTPLTDVTFSAISTEMNNDDPVLLLPLGDYSNHANELVTNNIVDDDNFAATQSEAVPVSLQPSASSTPFLGVHLSEEGCSHSRNGTPQALSQPIPNGPFEQQQQQQQQQQQLHASPINSPPLGGIPPQENITYIPQLDHDIFPGSPKVSDTLTNRITDAKPVLNPGQRRRRYSSESDRGSEDGLVRVEVSAWDMIHALTNHGTDSEDSDDAYSRDGSYVVHACEYFDPDYDGYSTSVSTPPREVSINELLALDNTLVYDEDDTERGDYQCGEWIPSEMVSEKPGKKREEKMNIIGRHDESSPKRPMSTSLFDTHATSHLRPFTSTVMPVQLPPLNVINLSPSGMSPRSPHPIGSIDQKMTVFHGPNPSHPTLQKDREQSKQSRGNRQGDRNRSRNKNVVKRGDRRQWRQEQEDPSRSDSSLRRSQTPGGRQHQQNGQRQEGSGNRNNRRTRRRNRRSGKGRNGGESGTGA